jgi:mono/diheme cytochrome c family protein
MRLLVLATCLVIGACWSGRSSEPTTTAAEQRPLEKSSVVARPASATPKRAPDIASGKQLYERMGCNACHSVDGQPWHFGTMYRFFGSTVDIGGGRVIVVDADYIRRVVLDPATANQRVGWRVQMPNYRGVATDENIDDLSAYIATLH